MITDDLLRRLSPLTRFPLRHGEGKELPSVTARAPFGLTPRTEPLCLSPCPLYGNLIQGS